MWFKQIQLFEIKTPLRMQTNQLEERLSPLEFRPCPPSMPSSLGWVSPLEEDEAPLVRTLNGCHLICLQIEEKILPASVINYTLKEKVKKLETAEARKIRKKEKLNFKDEVVHTLLPRAFSKFTRIYGYIDTKHQWLLVNTTSPGKLELFINLFKKSFGDTVETFDVIKPSAVMTAWLKNNDYPKEWMVEKSCVLQDPNQQSRVIRCQQQDLFATSIQSLVKDGCEVIQLGMCWQDRLHFVLADDFSLRGIRRAEDDLAEIQEITESKSQKMDAYFFMMTEMFAGMLNDLLAVFASKKAVEKEKLALTA
jgi:recombination associated protein RdgC